MIGNRVSIIPCRTSSSGEYSIKVSNNSFVGNNVSMKGDFILEEYTLINDSLELWDTLPPSSKEDVDLKVLNYIKDEIVKVDTKTLIERV